MRVSPLALALAVALLAVSCGAVGADAPAIAELPGPPPKVALGPLRLPGIALPTADGSWGVLDIGDERVDPLPCMDGETAYPLTFVTAGGSRAVITAADGSDVLASGYPYSGAYGSPAVPPGVRPGDPIALSTTSCDPASGSPTPSLLLGTIGSDGLPTGLTAILGPGAPEGAPTVEQPRGAEFWSTFSVERDTLVVVISTAGDPAPCCDDESIWNYDLGDGEWSIRAEPAHGGSHDHGLPTLLAGGGLIERVSGGMEQWTTYRGETLWAMEQGVGVDVAPDGSAALFTVSYSEGGEIGVVLMGTDGQLRTVTTFSSLNYIDNQLISPRFGPDTSTAYAGFWGFVPAPAPDMGGEMVLALWAIDLATGTQTKVMDLPGAFGGRVLPGGRAVLVGLGESSDISSQTWEIWPIPSV